MSQYKHTKPGACIISKVSFDASWERISLERIPARLRDEFSTTNVLQLVPKITQRLEPILHGILNNPYYRPIHTLTREELSPPVWQPQRGAEPNVDSIRQFGDTPPSIASNPANNSVTTQPYHLLPGNARLLLTLLCFLADAELSNALLHRGSLGKRRWTHEGFIEDSESPHDPLLKPLLANEVELAAAVCKLKELNFVVDTGERTYAVNRLVREEIIKSLDNRSLPFWRREALYTVSGAVPLKYLDRLERSLENMLITHLRHVTVAVRLTDGYERIPLSARSGIADDIIGASRFPGLDWKKFAINEAKQIVSTLQDPYLSTSLKHRQSLLQRLQHHEEPLEGPQESTHPTPLSKPRDRKMHALFGHSVRQKALDHYQKEELTAAIAALDQWQLCYPLTPFEESVACENNILRGKILRFQGKFQESLDCLYRVRDSMTRCSELFWDEDVGSLVCEQADVMLNCKMIAAEPLLRKELETPNHTSNTRALFRIALAECFFYQTKYSDAKQHLEEVKSDCLAQAHRKPRQYLETDELHGLSKTAKLRHTITMAKVLHVQNEWDVAFEYWNKALMMINKIPPTSGHATKIIHESQRDLLMRMRKFDLMAASHKEIHKLETVSRNSEATHWIPGLLEWEKVLTVAWESTPESEKS